VANSSYFLPNVTPFPESIIYEILISGNDIYAVGSEYDEGVTSATIWKNGIATRLGKKYTSRARGIFVSGNDVYVCGESNGIATIWKNETPTNLPTENGTLSSRASSIFVKGNDVYVVGTASSQQNGSWITKSVLWKNGVMNVLPSFNQNLQFVIANSIFVHENDVYIAGYEDHPTNPIGAVLWKNGVINQLSSNTLSGATSVYVK